ncbi:MAG TPA: DUF4286 family protein [Mucilaginibacter sp.]|jgi:hypothetical protein|nr:DUF4286 family protein [Mucilaginibacter sp.]
MLIYNETFIIDDAIVDDWLRWIRDNHIPSVLGTGSFDGYKLYTVLDSPNEGITYCLQFQTTSVERYSDFYYKQMEAIHAAHNVRFEERFALFHTLMEGVDL